MRNAGATWLISCQNSIGLARPRQYFLLFESNCS